MRVSILSYLAEDTLFCFILGALDPCAEDLSPISCRLERFIQPQIGRGVFVGILALLG